MNLLYGILIMAQVGLFSYGFYSFLQPNPSAKAIGVFMMLVNLISGYINFTSLMGLKK